MEHRFKAVAGSDDSLVESLLVERLDGLVGGFLAVASSILDPDVA